ncbi:unnamed protein product [Medioppia subpectinata]|uniref:Deacetylase sirtuin-type domain-containing protein n=1 Tax=Medioppia subpectinata TaxID=1979941 RepID=A0A7R9LC87_9ACAR|nr:unnamed protein product [Medioppia subpectinata]CAG2117555.1 unnamed protein product [Medioppia subpectinata]
MSDSGFDSGFQEFVANIDPKESDSTNDNTNDSQKYGTSGEEVGLAVTAHSDMIGLEGLVAACASGATHLAVPKGSEFEDVDDAASDVSDLSCMSCLSDMSGQQWKPISGPVAWIHKQMCSGTDPRTILTEMVADNTLIPNNLDNLTLWRIIVNMLSEPPPRRKLSAVNTLDDCIQLIKKSNRILVLTGAGVSVSCGIPDFRSRDGIYARLSKDFPDLPDPQAMFDIHYFRKDPRPFFKFAKCPQCPDDPENMAVIKPDIVFFGEGLSDEFHSAMSRDKDECDLMIVMGSSLKVRPVALIPSSIPETVPQILINREPLNHLTFDVELLGDCDVIVKQLCDRYYTVCVTLCQNWVLGAEWVDYCQGFGSADKSIESKKSDDFSIEVNNNTSQQISSSLPFAFNTTVNELRVTDHNTCHQNDNKYKPSDDLNPDSTQSETPKPSDDRFVSHLTDDKYIHFPPSRYIFKGAEVFDSDLSTHKTAGDVSEDDSSSTSSSLSTNACSSSSPSSSSSSSLSTSDSLLSPVNSNSNNFTDASETTKNCYSYSPTLSPKFSIPSEHEISKT